METERKEFKKGDLIIAIRSGGGIQGYFNGDLALIECPLLPSFATIRYLPRVAQTFANKDEIWGDIYHIFKNQYIFSVNLRNWKKVTRLNMFYVPVGMTVKGWLNYHGWIHEKWGKPQFLQFLRIPGGVKCLENSNLIWTDRHTEKGFPVLYGVKIVEIGTPEIGTPKKKKQTAIIEKFRLIEGDV